MSVKSEEEFERDQALKAALLVLTDTDATQAVRTTSGLTACVLLLQRIDTTMQEWKYLWLDRN